MARLILASGSSFRRQLLHDAGFHVESIPAEIVEPDPAGFADLGTGLMPIAQLKAQAVADRGTAGLIFAADTVGHVGGKTFGKPADRAGAQRMLEAISGT